MCSCGVVFFKPCVGQVQSWKEGCGPKMRISHLASHYPHFVSIKTEEVRGTMAVGSVYV